MAFGAIKIFGPTLRRRLLSNMGEGAPPTAEYFDYTLQSNFYTISNSAIWWNPACSAADHLAETSGVGTSVSTIIYGSEADSAGVTRKAIGEIIKKDLFSGNTLESGSFDLIGNYTGNIAKAYMTKNRQSNGATPTSQGRYRILGGTIDNQAAFTKGYVDHTASFNISFGSSELPSVSYSYPGINHYGAANTGGDFANQGGDDCFHHEWFKSTDLDSSGNPYLEVDVFIAPRGDPAVAYTFVRTVQLFGVNYKILENAIHGLGVPTNSDGVSFMHSVNLITGQDELLICNGHIIQKFDGFNYNTINSSSDDDVLQSAAVNTGTIKQGMISYFDSTEKFMDILMFSVTCASTTSIEIDVGELFTIELSNQSKPRLGQGNKTGRLMLSTTDNGSNTYVRTLQSSSVNDLRMCNGVSVAGSSIVTNHTCLNRFVDAAGTDNFLFLVTYSAPNTSLKIRGITRSTAASVAYVDAGYVFADSSTDYVEDTI